jgi:hypothetical protein
MKTERLKHLTRFSDNGGTWPPYVIEIQNDCAQMRIENEDQDVHFDTDRKSLEAIRDAINSVLNTPFP